MIKYFKYTLIVITGIGLIIACDKNDEDYCEPDEICYTQKPDSLFVKVELSSNPSSNEIEVNLYKNHLDDGELYYTFTTTNSEEYILAPVDERYTGTAKYLKDSDTIIVIDSDKLKAESHINCEEYCYDWEKEIVLDLKLTD